MNKYNSAKTLCHHEHTNCLEAKIGHHELSVRHQMQDSDFCSFAIRTLHVSATLADCDNMEIDDITLFVLLCSRSPAH